MIIYVITNKVNGKQYVGQTIRDIEVRFKQHYSSSSGCKIMKMAINKYGRDNFTIEQIDESNSIDELNNKEIYWIAKLNTVTPNGYNMTSGGEGTGGHKHTEETKIKMSNSKKDKYIGKNNPRARKVINLNTKRVFETIKDAHSYYNISSSDISAVCKGKIKTAGGYSWAYYENYLNGDYIVNKPKTKKVINLDTNEVFFSLTDASIKYGVTVSAIMRACKGISKTSASYRWAYLT